jgi:hypothetical protein
MGVKPLRKKFRYRDNTGASQAVHAAHWRDFTWEAGPVVVRAYGPWGQMQVWAVDELEARRVFLHACAIGGWELDRQLTGWEVGIADGGRNGRTATMRTRRTPLGTEVTKRPGPGGFPTIS